MTREEHTIALARDIAAKETGGTAPEAIMFVLARMALAGAKGASAGFLRAPPAVPVELKVDDHQPL